MHFFIHVLQMNFFLRLFFPEVLTSSPEVFKIFNPKL